ncbi:hypothetical protein SDC9_200817 [bioreactor metagenome]|uniref:5'-nucleotidase n=1 Tax=bioreactor metagenome TaxID=1076179 RepID=A0A645J131_9ZZZZ
MAGKVIDSNNDEDTDISAVKRGMISVTPVHFDLTNYGIMKMLEGWKISY